MSNGRRANLDRLLGQARMSWRAQADLLSHSVLLELLSRTTLLSLLIMAFITRDRLIQFDSSELPRLLLPAVVVGLAARWLQRAGLQVSPSAWVPTALSLEAGSLWQRLSLQLTTHLDRLHAITRSLLPRFHLEDSAAVQSITAFVQRMSRGWLELCAALELIMQRTGVGRLSVVAASTSSSPPVHSRGNPLAHILQTTVLLC
ncbi:MAG: hypothetical protein K6U78_11770 [Anaerolineae bacterium]|nr:hypothetical protein [Anaerolineae bacterium]